MYSTIIICMPFFGNHTFIELRALECTIPGTLQSWVQIPNLTAVSDGWVCTWECQWTLGWQTPAPAEHDVVCWDPQGGAPLTLQQLHFSASKGTQIAATSSTISILNKSSIQLWVSGPFLLGSLKNWYLLSIKHHQFSKNTSVFSCWSSN